MKNFALWYLVSGEWEEQEPIQAKNRKEAVKVLKSRRKKNGTWKLRLQ